MQKIPSELGEYITYMQVISTIAQKLVLNCLYLQLKDF